MPYLASQWVIDNEVVTKGTWVPERDWQGWKSRGSDLDATSLSWRTSSGSHGTAGRTELDVSCLNVLARDLADAQRDGLLYTNLFERLKNSPDDATADAVVDQMQSLGLASANWPESAGGPPPRQSARPFKRVLDWLFGLIGQVGRFILSCVDGMRASLNSLGISAIAVDLSLPPGVSFELEAEQLGNAQVWDRARQFFDGLVSRLEDYVFS